MLKNGFTLIELLIVILIISIITILGISNYKKFITSAKDTACITKHDFVTKWFEVEMMQCRLGIQPHAEPGRGDQTYDFPDYGYIKNNPRYPSCRGTVKHHAEGISQGWGYRYMNPYIGDCDDTKNNCYPNKGFFFKKGDPTINGNTYVWGYYEKLNKLNNNNFNTNIRITFKSLCKNTIYKNEVITSHEYITGQSEINKYLDNVQDNNDQLKENNNTTNNNNLYIESPRVY